MAAQLREIDAAVVRGPDGEVLETHNGIIDERTLHSRAGYDPFHAFTVTGTPVLTLSRGEVIARDGALLSRPGRGPLTRLVKSVNESISCATQGRVRTAAVL